MTSDAHALLWHPSPESIALGNHEVHLWRSKLDLQPSRVQTLEQTLAADERQRASQFRFPTDRARFIVARGVLRSLLGRYLSKEPHTLQFTYNAYGKPALAEESVRGPILFNATHSQGMALYAFTRIGDIGIDLEQMTTKVQDYEHIARRFFSSAEIEELHTVPVERRQEAFLNCWTRKEAYIKARGLGLSLVLSQFDVSLTPGATAKLLATREIGQEASQWSLHDLAPGPGCVAALTVKGHPSSIICWDWPE